MDLRNKTYLVEGLGVTGVAAVRLLSAHGATVHVHDLKSANNLQQRLTEISGCANCSGTYGVELENLPPNLDGIVMSPGVPLDKPWIAEAKAAGIEVFGDVELMYRMLPEDAVVVGITGTNGKSTVTSLIGHILRVAGKKTFVGGNIGRAALDAFSTDEKYTHYVLELSSFQLDVIQSMHMDVAVLLNITPDHLDRYGDFNAYKQSKAAIFKNLRDGDTAVINADDPHAMTLAQGLNGTSRYFSRTTEMPKGANCSTGAITVSVDGAPEQYFLGQYQLVGAANVENMMAAILATRAMGISPQIIDRALGSFHGLPHRLEFIGEKQSVKYINDSKATNPSATVKAILGFAEPIIWLAGGSSKGLSFDELRDVVKDNVSQALLFGESAQAIADTVGDVCACRMCENLEEALAIAAEDAEPGDVVLLSPACASFDQFRNFEHRGDMFRNIVKNHIL